MAEPPRSRERDVEPPLAYGASASSRLSMSYHMKPPWVRELGGRCARGHDHTFLHRGSAQQCRMARPTLTVAPSNIAVCTRPGGGLEETWRKVRNAGQGTDSEKPQRRVILHARTREGTSSAQEGGLCRHAHDVRWCPNHRTSGVLSLTMNRGERLTHCRRRLIAALDAELGPAASTRDAGVAARRRGQRVLAATDCKEMRAHVHDKSWQRELFCSEACREHDASHHGSAAAGDSARVPRTSPPPRAVSCLDGGPRRWRSDTGGRFLRCRRQTSACSAQNPRWRQPGTSPECARGKDPHRERFDAREGASVGARQPPSRGGRDRCDDVYSRISRES